MAEKFPCVACRKDVAKTANNRYRSHKGAESEPCEMASVEIPDHVLANGPVDGNTPADVPRKGVDYAKCPACGRNAKLTRLGYFEPHDETLRGGERCPVSGTRYAHARSTEDLPLPGDDIPEKGVYMAQVPKVTNQKEVDSTPVNRGLELENPARRNLERTPMAPAPDASSGASTGSSSPESATTSTPSPQPEPEPSGPFSLGISVSGRFLQPGSPFLQPPKYEGPVKPEPMGELAKELATRIKETFYSYSNRKSSDNRSAQTTLGPSEIGTPCDRRLAMALMNVPAVNPGGDGWAAFVGTCTHVGMAEIYSFADAGTGRYAVEMPVFLGVPTVPKGTTDLLDRMIHTVIDWKVMGAYSLKKFKEQGPSPTYRTQAHVYGLGAERAGEKVKDVAVVGLPRAGSSLDEMHVWTEPFDRKFAQAALDRVEAIAQKVDQLSGRAVADGTSRMDAAAEFPTADDCRYCPFHLKNDKEMDRGCPGK